MSETDVDQVRRVVRNWAKAFSSNNAEAIMKLWDPDYPKLIHQAEEFPDPIRGYVEISRYNEGMAQAASGFRDHAVQDLEADVIGDVAWCYLRGSVTFDWPGLDKPIRGQARQTFILRRKDGEWKLIHYHESRETPGLRGPLSRAHPQPERMTDPLPETYSSSDGATS